MDYTLSRKETIVIKKLAFPGLYPVAELSGVFKDGSISASISRTIKTQAQFTYIGDDLSDGDFIQISVILDNGYEQEEIVLATLRAYYTGKTKNEKNFTCYSLAKILDSGRYHQPFSVAESKDPFDYVEQILSTVKLKTAYRPTEKNTIRVSKSFLPEDYSKLDIINELLDNAGYLALDTNEYGLVIFRETTSTPRYSSIVFSEGEASIVRPSTEEEHDWSEVANVVIVTCENADDKVLRAIAINDSPTDETSTMFRGEVVRVESMSDADSQQVVEDKAKALLAEEQSKLTAVTFEHAYRPIHLFDHVSIDLEGVSGVYTVQSYEISLTPGLITKTRVRRFEL